MKRSRMAFAALALALFSFSAECSAHDPSPVLDWFAANVYGPIPPKPEHLEFFLAEQGEAFGGKAVRRQYRIFSRNAGETNAIDVLAYLPKGAMGPVPAFMCPNFYGNHAVTGDDKVLMPSCRPYGGKIVKRGAKAGRHCVEDVLARGYAYVTHCYGSTYPDTTGDGTPGCFDRDMSGESIWRMYPGLRGNHPLAHGAWAWGTMRVRDLLETIAEIDRDRVAIAGHSRMAKSAIIVGAYDSRFALVCANGGGVKPLAELPYERFPHWFKPRCEDLKYEQADLLKCIAPRALLVSSSHDDRFSPTTMAEAVADAADPAWLEFGSSIARHSRPGDHSITRDDWKAFLDYAEKTLGWKGPVPKRADAGDQHRFFWGIHQGIYTNLVAMGFNMIVDGMGSKCNALTATMAQQTPAFTNLMPRMAADGISFVMQLPFTHLPYLQKRFPRTFKDGTKDYRVLEIENPELLSLIGAATETCARHAAKYPACVGMQPASEVRIRTHPSCTPAHARRYRRETGREMPPEAGDRAAPHWSRLKGIPADRAVDENHPVLAYYKWFWQKGDGWNAYYENSVAQFDKAFGGKAFTMFDPCVRCPPLWGSGGPVSHINQWQVLYPFPSRLAYIASQVQAMARGRKGQRTLLTAQGIASRWEIAPKETVPPEKERPLWLKERPNVGYLTTPAALMRVGLWEIFSRKVDGFGFHGWDAIFDGVPHGLPALGGGYQFTDPGTAPAIADEFRRAAIPLGPLFKAIPERESEVAVLESYASALLSGKAPWDWRMSWFSYGELAQVVNLAPRTIYEEEIARDGIPASVKVILMSGCDVLTRTTAKKIAEFRKRGGKVVGDSATCPAVGEVDAFLPVLPVWSKHDGKSYDDAFRASARSLRDILRPYGVVPYADADDRHMLARARSVPGADYLFAINDKRKFGGATAAWKRIMEVGEPNSGKVSSAIEAGAVYDLVRNSPVPFKVVNGRTEVPVSFDDAGGTVFMLAKRPLSPLRISAVMAPGGYKVKVETADRDVLVPVSLTFGGETVYGVVSGGEWRRTVPATRVPVGGKFSVVNLADGKRYFP